MSDCSDYPTASTAKTFKLDAETTNEVVTLQQDRTPPASDGKTKKTFWGIENDATLQRENIDQLAEQQRENLESTFTAQFAYKRIGNISLYVGDSLPEADKLNSYQYPDDSGEWYGPVQDQVFPITIPADPSSDDGWALVNALTSASVGGLVSYTSNSVADMVLGVALNQSVQPSIGQSWVVLDYYGGLAPSASGILFFKVVPDGTGTPDGGKIIQGSGVQFEQNLKIPVSIKAFGAKGDNLNDDNPSVQAAIDYTTEVYAPRGDYLLHSPVNYRTQSTIFSDHHIGYQGPGARFIINESTWDGSPAMFTRVDTSIQAQAVRFQNVGFQGWGLFDGVDIGVSGIDASNIRDGIETPGCSFVRLGHGINQLYTATGYVGFSTFENTSFQFCNRAVNLETTTGISFINSKIYDCWDWIQSNKVTLINTAFNNSGFTIEYCSIHARIINMIGGWIEGGNRWFDSTTIPDTEGIKWTMDGVTVSEAFSGAGSTKFMSAIKGGDSVFMEMKGIKFPLNTRVMFDASNVEPLQNVNLELSGCSEVGTLWGRVTGDLSFWCNNGLSYRGRSNTPRSGYDDAILNSDTNLRYVTNQAGSPGLAGYKIGPSVSLDISINDLGLQSATIADPTFAEFKIISTNNGAGGNAVHTTTFMLAKGYNDVWVIYDKDQDGTTAMTSRTLSIANVSVTANTTTGCTLNITMTSTGSNSEAKLYTISKAANLILPKAFP